MNKQWKNEDKQTETIFLFSSPRRRTKILFLLLRKFVFLAQTNRLELFYISTQSAEIKWKIKLTSILVVYTYISAKTRKKISAGMNNTLNFQLVEICCRYQRVMAMKCRGKRPLGDFIAPRYRSLGLIKFASIWDAGQSPQQWGLLSAWQLRYTRIVCHRVDNKNNEKCPNKGAIPVCLLIMGTRFGGISLTCGKLQGDI